MLHGQRGWQHDRINDNQSLRFSQLRVGGLGDSAAVCSLRRSMPEKAISIQRSATSDEWVRLLPFLGRPGQFMQWKTAVL